MCEYSLDFFMSVSFVLFFFNSYFCGRLACLRRSTRRRRGHRQRREGTSCSHRERREGASCSHRERRDDYAHELPDSRLLPPLLSLSSLHSLHNRGDGEHENRRPLARSHPAPWPTREYGSRGALRKRRGSGSVLAPLRTENREPRR